MIKTVSVTPQVVSAQREGMLHTAAFSLLLFLFFQNISLLSAPGGTGSSVKLYHVYGLVMLFFMPLSQAAGRLPRLPLLFFGVALCLAAFNAARYGFSARISTLLYAFVFFWYFFQVARHSSPQKVLMFIQYVIILLFFAIFIKNIFFWKELSQGYGANLLKVYYFFPGGQNIEAGWLGLFTLLFLRQRAAFFLPLVAYALFIGLLYQSRTGQLISLLSIGLYGSWRLPVRLRYGAALLFLSVLILLILSTSYEEALAWVQKHGVGRFGEIGAKNDGFGKRVLIWAEALPLIHREWFLGYGIGNIIPMMSKETSLDLFENNLHNIYLQMVADGGMVMLIPFVLLLLHTAHRYLAGRVVVPEFALFLLGYAGAGLVQFTGMEILFWSMAGLYYGYQQSC